MFSKLLFVYPFGIFPTTFHVNFEFVLNSSFLLLTQISRLCYLLITSFEVFRSMCYVPAEMYRKTIVDAIITKQKEPKFGKHIYEKYAQLFSIPNYDATYNALLSVVYSCSYFPFITCFLRSRSENTYSYYVRNNCITHSKLIALYVVNS